MITFLKLLVIGLFTFAIIDIGWITGIVRPLYSKYLPHFLADQLNLLAAITFYVVFVFGLTYFVIQPAVKKKDVSAAFIPSIIYGLVTYATFDLTNMAVFKNWPLIITATDVAWGIVLSFLVSTIATTVAIRFKLAGTRRI